MTNVPKAIPEKQGLKPDAVQRNPYQPVGRPKGHSRKTRIETTAWGNLQLSIIRVPKAIPEKQGLKHLHYAHTRIERPSPKGHSRKTRIETKGQ